MSDPWLSIVLLSGLLGMSLSFYLLLAYRSLWTKPLRRVLGLHVWSYRNPFDRTCEQCRRHEVFHGWSYAPLHQGWWEVFNEGNGRRAICTTKTATREVSQS